MNKTTTAGAAALLAAGALACAVPTAAQAASAETTLVLTAGCIPAGQEKALVTYTWNFVDGESPVGPILDGRYPSDVADTYVGPGVHTYTYMVIDLATQEETVKGPFTFTVEACETAPTVTDVTPQAPTQTGDTVVIPVAEGVVYRDKATGGELGGSIVLPRGAALEVVATPRDERYRILAGATAEWRFVFDSPVGPGDGSGGDGTDGTGGTGGTDGTGTGTPGGDGSGGDGGATGSSGSNGGGDAGAPRDAVGATGGERLATTGAPDLTIVGVFATSLLAAGAAASWGARRRARRG